ncbi:unnamed protein product [Diatraea saccharalis]|uniref:Tudor domain-containing protein n=1 Tax=Diatraea saccharalis TaxID=40085 RepID=A0A9N9W9F5_9NEOP|nr:unnamed protein product [Diatraea saccharalis]
MSIDEASFWVITDNVEEVCGLMKEMTEFYNSNHFDITLDDLNKLTYCAFYDEDCFYRALFLKLIEEDITLAEVFLVDTGEVRSAPVTCVQPLEPRFCMRPPYARCCHLAGGLSNASSRILLKLLAAAYTLFCNTKASSQNHQNKSLMAKQELFMKEYVGIPCTIEVDDNTSESLGVYVILPSKQILNDILVQEGLALASKSIVLLE